RTRAARQQSRPISLCVHGSDRHLESHAWRGEAQEIECREMALHSRCNGHELRAAVNDDALSLAEKRIHFVSDNDEWTEAKVSNDVRALRMRMTRTGQAGTRGSGHVAAERDFRIKRAVLVEDTPCPESAEHGTAEVWIVAVHRCGELV